MSVAMVCMINHTHLAMEATPTGLSENDSLLHDTQTDNCVNRLSNSTKVCFYKMTYFDNECV